MLTNDDFEKVTAYTPPHIYSGKITRVKDGDTLVVLLDLPFRVKLEIAIRVKDINTAETYRPCCPGEREFGKYATDRVKGLCFDDRRCIIRSFKQSFTRWVADVVVDSSVGYVDLREFIIAEKLQKADLDCSKCKFANDCDSKYYKTFPNKRIKREK